MSRPKSGWLGALSLAISTSLFSLAACRHVATAPPPPVDLAGQNWSDAERYLWYRGSQGSRLIPEAWLMALEAPHTTTLFMDPVYFSRYNYLSGALAPPPGKSLRSCPTAGSDDLKLPIGFARDCQSDVNLEATRLRWYQGQTDRESWIGLNCAACHTNQITYQGQSWTIDGAPTLADFQGFTDDLRKAMRETYDDSAKWDRFAARVVAGRKPGEKNVSRVAADMAQLKSAALKWLNYEESLAAFNKTDDEYGYGRLDAVGHILNKVAFINDSSAPIRGEPNAPVSYPFIWNANQHDFVQWNGLVPNQKIQIGRGKIDAGALIRNTSEVIGVFAEVRTRREAGLKGYQSSVDLENLVAMEQQLGRLMSPKWPAALGSPGPADEIAYGRRLFKERCAGCHAPLERNDLTTPIVAEMTPIGVPGGIGTDLWMACNVFAYQARGGKLTGTKARLFGDKLPAIGPTREYLATQAFGVLANKKFTLLRIALRTLIGIEGEIEVYKLENAIQPTLGDQPLSIEQRKEQCIDAANAAVPGSDDARILAYKGRPLNGIWATAPYLHNGSVRTLYDLLLPPQRRPKGFWVGNREFDPVMVGFADRKDGNGWQFSTKDATGRDIIGNSNLGHDYGNADLDEDYKLPNKRINKRMALIAYMRTL